MKRIYLLLILILVSSCSQKTRDIRIIKFEETLGKTKIESFNLLVSDFEKNLDKIYPDLPKGKAYRQYLTDIILGGTTDYKKFNFKSTKTQTKLHKSGLWDDIYTKNHQGFQPNLNGDFMKYLNEIGDSDPLIKKYYEKKKILGNGQIELFMNDFINSDIDFSDYFHKRIVILEFIF